MLQKRARKKYFTISKQRMYMIIYIYIYTRVFEKIKIIEIMKWNIVFSFFSDSRPVRVSTASFSIAPSGHPPPPKHLCMYIYIYTKNAQFPRRRNGRGRGRFRLKKRAIRFYDDRNVGFIRATEIRWGLLR